MSDMISRRQIHDYIQSQINPYGKPFEGTAYEFGLKIMDYIKNMSTVEPVHGEWISKGRKLECSNCGHRVYLGTDDLGLHEEEKMVLKFCSGYGADMRK